MDQVDESVKLTHFVLRIHHLGSVDEHSALVQCCQWVKLVVEDEFLLEHFRYGSANPTTLCETLETSPIGFKTANT